MYSIGQRPETVTGVCPGCQNKKRTKRFHKKNPDWAKGRRRGYQLKCLYGLTEEQYDVIWSNQRFRCFICHDGDNPNRQFPVDHDHNTGEIRGILCQSCNRALGILKDDLGRLERAIEYLKR